MDPTGSPAAARDSQRARLYRAEQRVFPTMLAGGLTLTDCQAFLDQVTETEWFTTRWRLPHPPVVRAGRGGAVTTGHSIEVGVAARTRPLLVHELAHVVAATARAPHGAVKGPLLVPARAASHGPEFAAIYLRLVRHVFGAEPARALRHEFRAERVRYRAAARVAPEVPARHAAQAVTTA